MVFGFFKKKKKVPAKPKEAVEAPQDNTIFNSQIKNSKTAPQATTIAVGPQMEQWQYDLVVQFLHSPAWQTPLIIFQDEHCLEFDQEEDKPEYHELHSKFKKLNTELINDMLAEVEIPEEKFVEILHVGLTDPAYKRTFEQLLVADNYQVFKILMIKRNKELELEAMQQLNEIEKNSSDKPRSTTDLDRLTLEKEEAEIQHAVALSVAVDQERQKLIDQEDHDMQEAIRQSEAEYKQYQEHEELKASQALKEKELKASQAVKEEEELRASQALKEKQKLDQEGAEKRQREAEREALKLKELQKAKELAKFKAAAQAKAQAEAQAQAKATETPKEDVVEEQKLEASTELPRGKKLEPLKNAPKANVEEVAQTRQASFLPPIKGSTSFEQVTIEQPQAKPKEEEKKNESLEERKQRLKAQRDLIIAKKKAQAEADLKKYEANKKSGAVMSNVEVPAISGEEADKRRHIYEKLKGEL